MKRFLGREVDGTIFEAEGEDAPLPGLAIVSVTCRCGTPALAICHVRSGAGLFHLHDRAQLGREVWLALSEIDWTRPAADLEADYRATEVVVATMAIVPGAFQADAAEVNLDDLPRVEQNPPA